MIHSLDHRKRKFGLHGNTIQELSNSYQFPMMQAGPQMPANEILLDKVKCIEIPIATDDRKPKTYEISVVGIRINKN